MRLKKMILISGLCTALSMAGSSAGFAKPDQPEKSETENAEQNGDAGEAVSDAPLKIYGTITKVKENAIVADNLSDTYVFEGIILNIDPENTVLADGKTGLPLTIEDIKEGLFEAYLGPIMTLSLPPQTTPYVVIANISEDEPAPQYAVLSKDLIPEDDGYLLETTGGERYKISEDVEISAFRTKNIVTAEDLTEGKGCLIWTDEEGGVSSIKLLEGTPQF